nr:choice-of-anchor A family protein [Oerskovia turbata]
MITPHRARRTVPPFGRAVAAVTATVLGLTGALALGTGPLAAPASAATTAQLPQCPAPGEMPGIGNLPAFTDSNIAVYAGGDYSATGTAAESEGLLVVMGDATFDKAAGGVYNVGSAGVGSQITPPGGTTMLAVGGDLTVGPLTTMDVGANVVGGGNVDVGGSITNTVPLALNGGVATPSMGAAAVASYTSFQDVITEESRLLAQPAGTPGKIEPWGELRFTGDPDASLHTFTVDGAALTSLGKKVSVFFDEIGGTAPIVVNVTGSAVDLDAQSFFFGTTQVNALSSPELGNAASRILWNFVDATSVELGENDQFMGSILAPHADVTLTTSTNGRVYVGKTLSVLGIGGGIEQHNYPWTGSGPFTCLSDEPGGFTVTKNVVGDGADLVPTGTEFTVDYSYTAHGTPVTGTLTVTADGTVVNGPAGLPAGTVVTLSEPDLPLVPGVDWGTPSFAPSDTVTIGATGTVAVRLTNTASAQVGGFSIAKALTGLASDQVPSGTEFTVAYTVTADGASTQGTVTVLADGTVVDGPQDLPVGAVVTFTETDLPTVPGVVWGEPSFEPASVTVSDGANPLVTLTNSADAALVPVGGFSVRKVVANAPEGTVPAGTGFTVRYSYLLEGTPTSGTLTVTADGTAVDGPQNLRAGTVVTFEEIALPTIDGVVWGAPVFSPATITVGAGTSTSVTLTNTVLDTPSGGFSLAKAVTGPAADQVDLPSIDGVVWGEPVFSPAQVVVADGESTAVTLTNTANAEPAGGRPAVDRRRGVGRTGVQPGAGRRRRRREHRGHPDQHGRRRGRPGRRVHDRQGSHGAERVQGPRGHRVHRRDLRDSRRRAHRGHPDGPRRRHRRPGPGRPPRRDGRRPRGGRPAEARGRALGDAGLHDRRREGHVGHRRRGPDRRGDPDQHRAHRRRRARDHGSPGRGHRRRRAAAGRRRWRAPRGCATPSGMRS